ncbi:hypothetical protein EfmJHP10_05570 [Enterococcus faecium]|nr:hypothetical protein EfmJHP10_05570 [Enterococcus faecium]
MNKFTGTLDLYDGSKLGLIYAPRATVTLDGVSGVLDVQPVKEGMNAAPGKEIKKTISKNARRSI